MRYLVTGGAGFIGSHLVDALVAAGEDVVVLDDFSTGKRSNLTGVSDRVEIVEGSITSLDDCARVIRGCDYVLHQAALPSVQRSISDPAGCHAVNATGTLNVLVAARDARVRRVIMAGSSSVYGNVAASVKREDMPTRPLSPYAASKAAAEAYCRAFHASYGLETVVLRYFNIFGPRQDPESQYAAVVPRFITAALRGTSPTIFGDGEQTRDFTFVGNAVAANLLACRAPHHAVGHTFNVACGERHSVNDLWQRIVGLTGSTAQATYAPPRTGDVRDSLASLDAARELLGYEPQVGLTEGLERTVEAFAAPATNR